MKRLFLGITIAAGLVLGVVVSHGGAGDTHMSVSEPVAKKCSFDSDEGLGE